MESQDHLEMYNPNQYRCTYYVDNFIDRDLQFKGRSAQTI